MRLCPAFGIFSLCKKRQPSACVRAEGAAIERSGAQERANGLRGKSARTTWHTGSQETGSFALVFVEFLGKTPIYTLNGGVRIRPWEKSRRLQSCCIRFLLSWAWNFFRNPRSPETGGVGVGTVLKLHVVRRGNAPDGRWGAEMQPPPHCTCNPVPGHCIELTGRVRTPGVLGNDHCRKVAVVGFPVSPACGREHAPGRRHP